MVGKLHLDRAGRVLAVACFGLLCTGVGLLIGLVIGGDDDETQAVRRPDVLKSSMRDYAWRELAEAAFPFPPYAVHLKDVSIVLDPGHGGRADLKGWKRGPTGLREAEVNLRVAQFLRDFLVEAGASVFLTRESDRYLHEEAGQDLSMRIALANELQADLFLSIHHNAAAVQGSPANYSTMYYHGSPDDSPASVDAAWRLLSGLNDALRLEQHLPCGVVSDYALYSDKGLRVLREAYVPAVLSEASFHSNPEEEKRLRDPAYNRREAYGLFLGLARWAQGGLPRVRFARPEAFDSDGALVIQLDDGLSSRRGYGMHLPQLETDSIVVGYEGRSLAFDLLSSGRQVKIRPPEGMLSDGGLLYVDFVNLSGHHVLHPWLEAPTEE